MSSQSLFPFVGRTDVLAAFDSMLTLRPQRNTLFIQAPGGLGKTRVLHKIIQKCLSDSSDHWYLRPRESVIEPIIDFFEVSNRTVDGIRHSIIDRLGWGAFERFAQVEAELNRARKSDPGFPQLAALRIRLDEVFFQNFGEAVRQLRSYVVLAFDTFEVISETRAGQWFTQQFLAHESAKGCIVLVASRPCRVRLPRNVGRYVLPAFSDLEMADYFEQRNWQITASEIRQLQIATNGSPLLVDMAIYLRNAGVLGIGELVSIRDTKDDLLDSRQVEFALVDRLVRTPEPEHLVLQEMAILRRRYWQPIFDWRQSQNAYPEIQDYDTVCKRLLDNPYRQELRSLVKFRHEGRVITLHDEVQRLISEYAYARSWDNPGIRGDWTSLREELYTQVVQGWYPQAISGILPGEMEPLQRVLKAEHLGYLLEMAPVDVSVKAYHEYMNQAEQAADFELAELLWGEVQENRLVIPPSVGYDLAYEYAKWLSTTSQHTSAAHAYQYLAEHYSEPPTRRLFALSHLGNHLSQLGRFSNSRVQISRDMDARPGDRLDLAWIDTAHKAYDFGLLEAQRFESRAYQIAFRTSLGKLAELTGDWTTARKLYRANIDETLDGSEIIGWAHATVSLALLEARMGNISVAEGMCRAAISALLDNRSDNNETLAHAYYVLARVERYGSHPETAHNHYEAALSQVGGKTAYRAIYLSDRGINFYERGLVRRSEFADLMGDIEHQSSAFDDINQSIALMRSSDNKRYLADGLRRMGKVFEEISELDLTVIGRADDATLASFLTLVDNAGQFVLIEEDRWRNAHRLVSDVHFEALDWLAKAQRLFEVSCYQADISDQYHESLAGITDAARIALKTGRTDDVRKYIRFSSSLRGYAHQDQLFSTQTDIITANLDFDEGRVDNAIDGYSRHFLTLVKLGGFAQKRVVMALFRELEKRLKGPAISATQRSNACHRLQREWSMGGMYDTYPELLFRIQAIAT